MFELSSEFTQGDINASKLYTCSTADLVCGQQASSTTNRLVLAIVNDLGTLKAVVTMEASRRELKNVPSYIVNPRGERKGNTTHVIEKITKKLSSKQEKLLQLLRCIPGLMLARFCSTT